MQDIPVYKIAIDAEDDATGVKVVSFVHSPAIEEGFIALSKQKEKTFQALGDDVKQIITGPALIPDIEILRVDGAGEPYKIVFTTDAIEAINKKFFKEGNIFNTNLEHEEALDGNFIVESWIIKDSDKDKAKALGFNLPVGTWMLSYHIPNTEIYNALKEEATGFSIEGRFFMDEIENKKEEMKKSNSSLFNKVLAALKPLFLNEDCPTCGNKDGEKLGTNLSNALMGWIEELENRENDPIPRAEIVGRMAEEAGIDEGTVNGIISGEIDCPPMERVSGIARALPNANLDELQAAWEADGCGPEEDDEMEKEKVATETVEQTEEEAKLAEVTEKAAQVTAELKELKESTSQLMAQVDKLKAQLANKEEALAGKDAEIAELKKQPAGEKLNTVPGSGKGKGKKDNGGNDKKEPFHKSFIQSIIDSRN